MHFQHGQGFCYRPNGRLAVSQECTSAAKAAMEWGGDRSAESAAPPKKSGFRRD